MIDFFVHLPLNLFFDKMHRFFDDMNLQRQLHILVFSCVLLILKKQHLLQLNLELIQSYSYRVDLISIDQHLLIRFDHFYQLKNTADGKAGHNDRDYHFFHQSYCSSNIDQNNIRIMRRARILRFQHCNYDKYDECL